MAINLDEGAGADEHGEHDSGIDLGSLFRVLIREVQGLRQAQQETKEILSRGLNMKETFTTNRKTQEEARQIRDRVVSTESSSTRGDKLASNDGPAKPTPQQSQKTDATAGYTKKLKGAFGEMKPDGLPTMPTTGKEAGQALGNMGLALAKQLGDSFRHSVFQEWEKRDRAEKARQNGHDVPASADDRGANTSSARPTTSSNDARGNMGPAGKSKSGKRRGGSLRSAMADLSGMDEGRQNIVDNAGWEERDGHYHEQAHERILPTNGGDNTSNGRGPGPTNEGSPPPPAAGKTWSYGSANPNSPSGYTPSSPHGPYGPYGRYGTSFTTGGGGGGHGDSGGGGGGGGSFGNSHSQNGSYGENTGIGHFLKSFIPGAGLIFGGADEVKSQRNKNAYYQNIEGGSNASKFAERAHEEAYAATAGGLFGAFSEQEAREAFKGVTRIGYNGIQGKDFANQGDRQTALNFAYHGKTSYGADVSESLRQLEQASKDSTINLNTLQQALKGVSDAAGKAGVNSQMARQGMMNLIQTGTNNGLPGAASQNMAANIAQGQASMGRDFENYDYSGQLSSQSQYMVAAAGGMSRGQFINTMRENPQKAQQMMTGNKLEAAQSMLPPQMFQAIKDKIKDAGQKIDEPVARQIALQILDQFPDYANPDFWRGYVARVGGDQNASADLILTDLIMTIAGQDPQMQAQDQKTSGQPLTAKADSKGNLPSGVQTSNQGYMDSKQYGKWQSDAKAGGHGAASALMDLEKKGGRNRVIEGILQNTAHADHTKVEVHTKDGARVVSLEDAIKNHPEELASGSVRFMEGSNAGKTVSDVVGDGNVDSKADWMSESKNSKDSAGQSLDDYKKDHPDDSTKGKSTGANGTVTIDLTAAAKQLLQVQSTTGAAQSADAAGTGAPVQNDYNNNPTRNGSYGG